MQEGTGRLAPLTGAAFIVIGIVSFLVAGEQPDATQENAREIVEHYTDNKDSIFFGAGLAAVAGALLVFFGGFLRGLLGENDKGFLPTVAFAGTVIVATGVAIDATISVALAETADDISRSSVVTLAALWENDFVPFAMGGLIFLMATGLSTVRNDGGLPKWLGGVCIVVAATAPTPIGFVAFLGFALLVLVISVLLAVRAEA